MTDKNKKQFGVWMDAYNATIVGNEDSKDGSFKLVGHVSNPGPASNSSERNEHNHEIMLTQKFFKEIASLMPNVDEIHLTGTGQAQEQFMKFLADTPQYKNAISTECTSNKMSDENFTAFIENRFN